MALRLLVLAAAAILTLICVHCPAHCAGQYSVQGNTSALSIVKRDFGASETDLSGTKDGYPVMVWSRIKRNLLAGERAGQKRFFWFFLPWILPAVIAAVKAVRTRNRYEGEFRIGIYIDGAIANIDQAIEFVDSIIEATEGQY